MDFEAIETAARRQAMVIAAKVIEQKINSDHSDYVGPSRACNQCGKSAHYRGRRGKTFITALGEMTLVRAYYHCDGCDGGFCERDHGLGMKGSLSPAVTRMNGIAAATVSFKESSELLQELAAITVDVKQVEREAESLGREIDQDERSSIEPTTLVQAPTMYLGMDGTGIPMRLSELEGRVGKQADGSAKTREVKLVTVWTAETRDDKGCPTRDEGSVTYSAAIESAAQLDTNEKLSQFAERVKREAKRRNFDKAKRQVVIGDGAPWIWNLTAELFPDAIQIVDLYHAKGHLAEVGKSIYGSGTELAEQWRKQRNDELDEGKFDDLLGAIRKHEKNDDARKCLEYFTTNKSRMDYPKFRAEGLCVGSGVVEAGCKVTIGTRLKRAGMHWTVKGANAIAALRCCKLSGRFEEFWERRSTRSLALS